MFTWPSSTLTQRRNTSTQPRASRPGRYAVLAACALTVLSAPTAASAADTLVAPDPAASQVAALDGTVVWVSGSFGDQVLMQRAGGVVAPVKGALRARRYFSIDLGHNSEGKLVLTYQRCLTSGCKAIRDNLAGRRTSFRRLTLTRCSLSTAPAVWRSRLAYGLYCRTPNNQPDNRRSGLYVKKGSDRPRRLRLPADAVRLGVTSIAAVDLRSTRVAALAADIYEYAFTETVNGNRLRSLRVAVQEGETDEHAMGVSLGTDGILWTLVNSEAADQPNRTEIFKVKSNCYRREAIVTPPNQPQRFVAIDLAVDRKTLYLVVPGAGIVKHDFAPAAGCQEL